ncbi:type II secretion system protein M [Gallaecimonas sp. GXIMD4217]|uniref:type II secretion system protein M n=1 Tax=Gallaecimonas sp. GXIMD4217 TaxID=3131927 RepID=UPI00311AF59F
MNIKDWYDNLEARERRLIALAAPVALVGLLYWGIWTPLGEAVAQAQNRVNAKQNELDWLRDQGATVLAARGGSRPVAGGSLTQRVTNAARAHQITIARLQPTSSGVAVWVDDVAFDALTLWLAQLQQQGLVVSQADIAAGEASGKVKVRKLELVGA